MDYRPKKHVKNRVTCYIIPFSFTAASSLEWFHGIGIPAPQNHPLGSHLCRHAAPELLFWETRTALFSIVVAAPPHGRHKCVRCPNGTRTRAHPGRSGAPTGGSACCTTQC